MTIQPVHSSPYEYDAEVPLILVGRGICAGTYAIKAAPIDLAPAFSVLLGIEFPAGRDARILTEALDLH